MLDKEELRKLMVDDEFTNEDFDNLSDYEIEEMIKFCDVLQMLQSPVGNEEMLIQELKELDFIDVQYVKWYQKPYYLLKYYLFEVYYKIKGGLKNE